jgi:hypothetical protein
MLSRTTLFADPHRIYTYHFYEAVIPQRLTTPVNNINVIGARGSVVGWGTVLQARKSPIRVQDKVDFFDWPNLSSRTIAQESTQALTEMSIKNLTGGKERPARRADNLTAICELNVWKWRSLTSRNPKGLHEQYEEDYLKCEYGLACAGYMQVVLILPLDWMCQQHSSVGFVVLTMVIMNYIFWDTNPLSPFKANHRFAGIYRLHFHDRIISKRHIPPKRRLTFNGLHDVMSQKTEEQKS